MDDLRQRLAAYESVLERCGEHLADRAELDGTVHRVLARQALCRAAGPTTGTTRRVPVDELVAFAASCLPGYRSLPEYRGLAVRRRVGRAAHAAAAPLVPRAPMPGASAASCGGGGGSGPVSEAHHPAPAPRLTVNVHGAGRQPAGLTGDERAWWVSADELRSVLDAVAASPERVDLTVDDGFASDVDVVLPLLLERGLTATFSPCAGWLDTPGRVGADDVRALVAAGMPVGTHGWVHRDWRRLGPGQAAEEFLRSAAVLADVCGRPVTSAAVPFGSYDRVVLQHLRRAGYARVFDSDGGLVHRPGWRVPRTSVRPGAGPDWLRSVLRDATRPRRRVRAAAAEAVKALRGSPGR